MRRKAFLPWAAAAVLVAGAACHQTGNDIAGTVSQSKNVVNNALSSMQGAGRTDAQNALDSCVASAGCDGFSACIDGALQGGSGSGGSSAGSGGRAAASGGASASGGSGAGGTIGTT